MDIKVGDTVTVENITGQATGSPRSEIITGKVYKDVEGILRIRNANGYEPRVDRDADGYFHRGVIVLEVVPR